jgi:uncharacterized protein YjbJ (UPF0337 family)
MRMNKDQIAGNWKQLAGKVKEQWGQADRRRHHHRRGPARPARGTDPGTLRHRREQAEEQVSRWEKAL